MTDQPKHNPPITDQVADEVYWESWRAWRDGLVSEHPHADWRARVSDVLRRLDEMTVERDSWRAATRKLAKAYRDLICEPAPDTIMCPPDKGPHQQGEMCPECWLRWATKVAPPEVATAPAEPEPDYRARAELTERRLAELREPVLWFAEQMEGKLRTHDGGRGPLGWRENGCTDQFLVDRMMEEVHEAEEALSHSPQRLVGECVDVANFAMMAADQARQRIEGLPITESEKGADHADG